jgi:3-oxoacyl-[acyl-carrier protein] reductase
MAASADILASRTQAISEEMIEATRPRFPKGRLAKIDDIVSAYVFLASDESRHFVGQCLSPDGGDVML